MVLADRQPSRTRELALLADQLGEPLPEQLLALQVYAVEARYEEGPFALKTPRAELLEELEQRLASLEMDLKR